MSDRVIILTIAWIINILQPIFRAFMGFPGLFGGVSGPLSKKRFLETLLEMLLSKCGKLN